METSGDFVRAIRARYGITSDYQLAKTLRITRSAMSKYKTGVCHVFSEETGFRIAELLDLDAGHVLACLAAERSKDIKVKKVWERLAELTRVAIVAPVLFAVTLAGSALVTSPAARAAEAGLCILCQVARRWRQRLAAVTRRLSCRSVSQAGVV
ncbi:MAG TPA: helix-turn-helix transcriptional regulator [Acidiferrobacterales bacterium]|nr:helix-turn-helix transcriptional regulator [Acidiferrobacterales bacterium]